MAEGSLKTDNGDDFMPISMEPINKDIFAQVIFPDVQRFYPPNTDITCAFQKRIQFETGSRDWIGIFKVGWQTPKEYYTWLPVSKSENHVLFKAYYLPNEGNEEYYQFCYVDENRDVRGVSIPFQFRHEDLEEASGIFLVTREEEMENIQQDNIRLKNENESQAEKIQALEAKLRTAEEKNQAQQEDLLNCKKENETLQLSYQESEQNRTKMQDSLLEMEQMRKQLETYEAEKKHLQAQMSALENTTKLKEELQHSVEEQKMTMQDLENKFNESRINLEVANDNISTLKQQLALQQMENTTKDAEVKKQQLMITSIQEEMTKLRDTCKEHLREIENEKKAAGTLRVSMNVQNNKLLEIENQVGQLQADLRSAQERNTILEQKAVMLQILQDENRRQKEELYTLRSTIDLREEEIQDLQESYAKKISEIEDLNTELTRAHLAQAFAGPASIQSPGLLYGNPYDGAHSSIPVREEARGSSETVANEERPQREQYTCPECQLEFDNLQTLEDHVLCHSLLDD